VESTVKHSRFPLLSLPLLLFGCSSGEVVSAPTALDQTPPLNTQAPPLNPNAPPLNPNAPPVSPNAPPCTGTLAPTDSLPLLAEAFCAKSAECTTAGTPVEDLDTLCGVFATCAADPVASDCKVPTLPICSAELTGCLAAYLTALGCRSPDALDASQIAACSGLSAAVSQTGGTQVNTTPTAGTTNQLPDAGAG
jgi:hypothetical protein